MSVTEAMLTSHPAPPRFDIDALSQAIQACLTCAQACTSCADACLGEEDVAPLVTCIRLDLDCADICETTARMLSRQTAADPALLRAQVQTCVLACRTCGDECERHAEHMAHCDECAEACRRCEQACQRLLEQLAV